MYTTKMAHDDPVNAACEEKVQSDGLLSTLNNSGHTSKFFGNIFIYVHVNSPVYYTCKTVIGANSED
jgi:hypothetical protein